MTKTENYCGNCGKDLNGVTVAEMREIQARGRLCPACEQILAEAVAAGATDDDPVSECDE